MATRHGKEGVVKIGANTMKSTKWSIEESVDVSDDTSQTDLAKTHLVGIPGWSGTIDAWMNKAETNGQVALTIGASVTLNLYDDGTTPGQAYHSGTASVTRISRNVDIGGTIQVTFAFQGNGALSHPVVGA